MNSVETILSILLYSKMFLFSGVDSYGFLNCIQTYRNPNSYMCIQRFLQMVESAVSDLPSSAQYLNISHNNITHLYSGSFSHLQQLVLLRLDFNNLEMINEGAFEKLTYLSTLNISFNRISNLTQGAFRGLVNLTHLLLQNNRLRQIQADTFHLLGSLVTLDLSSNFLCNFSDVVHSLSPLKKLQTLNLCYNILFSLEHTAKFPSSLSKLSLCHNNLSNMDCQVDLFRDIRYLDLSYNHIKASALVQMNLRNVTRLLLANNLDLDIFQVLKHKIISPSSIDYSGLGLNNVDKLSNLCSNLGNKIFQKLSLCNNSIRTLIRHPFTHCPVIKVLDLSRNVLKYIGCLEFVEKKQDLEALVVEHNLLTKLPNCKPLGFKSLHYISFRYNRILTVRQNSFSYAPHLQHLKLNINNIAYLDRYAFRGLQGLKILHLDNNLITDLYKESFEDLRSLQILNLRNNRVSIIFKQTFYKLGNLQILDLGNNKIRNLSYSSFEGLRNLSNLYLDGNQIKRIESAMFSCVQSSLLVLDLAGNHLRYISTRNKLSPFEKMKNLLDLKLQAQQPYGINIIPPSFFKGLTSLKSLYLARNKILSIPPDVFDDLGQLRYLTLTDACNGIQNLPAGIFKNLRNLQELDLENVGLRSLTLEVFGNLTKLGSLTLMKNALKIVNSSVINNLTQLKYLDLRKCPLTCTCQNSWFINWLNKSKVQIVYPYNHSCEANPKTYISTIDTHICYLDIGMHLFWGTTLALILFMLLPITYQKCYWRIKYNFYIFRTWFNESWRWKEEEHFKYDAFISYNSCDEAWVLQELIPNLETNSFSSFRLCLHHRDFELGRDIIDNIVDSIYQSRKTICIISRSYLRSEWCSLEIQLASYRLFHELKDVLVLIFLEKIPDRELSAYHRMRKVMLKKTYINWPLEPAAQKIFWTKIRKALKGSEEDSSQSTMVE
ncbi:toll-like receptor 13 [Rhinatrema bivittatum]|uniref:toll-like receptor 13 n=1 Tax=Rhinatrema bivittatum TaxID=194408 RepID=UPI0011277968|nr:toll-like receptor 13 [Rhinatrema bivittatum]XP_029433210.1 toll-like receptor 13 [Rhinatrema bivittatum]